MSSDAILKEIENSLDICQIALENPDDTISKEWLEGKIHAYEGLLKKFNAS